MAAKGRRHPDNLIETLHDQPYRFEFFQAVRILEQLARRQSRDPRFAAMSPVGEDSEPSREAVRFKAAQALSFPTSEISTVRQPQADTEAKGPAGPTEMTVNFMGLTGPTGVMPQYDTETLIRSMRAKSLSLRDFLDLFNHRTISSMSSDCATSCIAPTSSPTGKTA